MSLNSLLRQYIDILNEAETSQVAPATADTGMTRRVTINPDGTTSGGFKPTPRDPNAPVDPKLAARQQRRTDAETANQAWLAQRPAGSGWGGKLPANLNRADVERIAQGENPDQVIMGRSHRGSFGTDTSQHRAMAQQWLDWHSKAPPKYDPMDDVDEAQANEANEGPSMGRQSELERLPKAQRLLARDLPPTNNDRKSGAFKSDVAVTKNDPKRVQVAPNVEKKVYDYEVKLDQAEKARQQQAMDQHPVWSGIGKFGGDLIGGARARWDALTGAGSRAIDQQTGYDRYPDPVKPVDIIPNPPRGTATPRESAQDHLARMRAVVAEAEQFKGITNQGQKSQDMMQEYKPKQ